MKLSSKTSALIGLVAAAFAALMGHLYMTQFERNTSGGVAIEVLSLIRDVPPGTTITAAMLGERAIPAAYLDDRSVLARDRDRIVGIDTVLPLKAQQTLHWTDLAVRTDIRNLSQIVTPGKRAVTVQHSNAAGSKLIRPGDQVDVITTMASPSGGRVALVILQKVLVVAVGLRTDQLAEEVKRSGNSMRDDSVLTLSLEVEEAQLLALATEQGKLSVAVRNPEDQRTYEDLPDMSTASLVQARDTLRARKRASSPGTELPTRMQAAP